MDSWSSKLSSLIAGTAAWKIITEMVEIIQEVLRTYKGIVPNQPNGDVRMNIHTYEQLFDSNESNIIGLPEPINYWYVGRDDIPLELLSFDEPDYEKPAGEER